MTWKMPFACAWADCLLVVPFALAALMPALMPAPALAGAPASTPPSPLPATASTPAQDSQFVGISLFGEYVPNGEGIEDANGDFDGEFDLAEGRICYYLDLMGIRGPTGIAIHRGDEGDNGPLVVELRLPVDSNEEVCVPVDAAVQREMLADLHGHYMIVTAPGKPDGAIRAQLDM